ncbi:hypothetical protein C8R43DRAFT_910220 [Mycena crocata]|nr:hypothetical protein C8R43DRAFT_910220 [Mycena crocata]
MNEDIVQTSRNYSANGAGGAEVKQQDGQLKISTKICNCACFDDCSCQCTCACKDHCVCRKPCDKNCGARSLRNLVVSIDGTSNQFGIDNTNVVELHSRIDAKADQIKYYASGIGTYVPEEAHLSFKYVGQWIDHVFDLAIASHFKNTILQAYKWLSQMYQPGDKIFIFGFSRGAYQARVLAGVIEKVGLVDPGNEAIIPLCVSFVPGISATNRRVSDQITMNFKNACAREVRVHFAGLWDMVSSVGVVRGKSLPLTSSAEHICSFRHALALDERRVKFLPEYVADGASSQLGGSKLALSNVKEVWFPGTHSDIGGGIKENLHLNLSSVPLLCMENEATTAGLRLGPPKPGGEWETTDLTQNDMHESLRCFWKLPEYLPLKHSSYKPGQKATTR